MEKIENGEFLIHSFEGKDCHNLNGLTKREYFAGLAMQGLLSNPNIRRPSELNENENARFSTVCIKYADELLKQLEK